MKISKRWAFALLGIGTAAVAVGVALIYPPAGLIVAGVALAAFAYEVVDITEPVKDSSDTDAEVA